MKTLYCRLMPALLIALSFFKIYGQTLEIHQISVGQGDAALIIVRDTAKLRIAIDSAHVAQPAQKIQMLVTALESTIDLTGTVKKAVLIDAGKGIKQADKIYDYMNKVGVTKLNYTALSHYHDDHYGGFKQLIQAYAKKPDTAYDRGYENKKPIPNNKAKNSYIKIVTNKSISRITAKADNTNVLLGRLGGQEIRFTTVANAGYTLGETQGPNPGIKSNDENDFSVVWLLQYGAFRFLTGGDMNGIADTKVDLETPLADALQKFDSSVFKDYTAGTTIPGGHACTFKINHHGGEESTNVYFLSTLRPKTVLISCGFEKGYKHPRIRVVKDLDRTQIAQWDIGSWTRTLTDSAKRADSLINNTIDYYYMTSLMERNTPALSFKNPADAALYANLGDTTLTRGIIGGDLVVIVDDVNIATESKFLTYWNGEKATKVVTGPVRNTTPKGTTYTRCHKATKLDYIVNH